jgi:porin
MRPAHLPLLIVACFAGFAGPALAQVGQGSGEAAPAAGGERKPSAGDKEEEHKPPDPDTGKSTLSHETLGLVPNPFEASGLKFSVSYVADVLGNPTGGLRQGAIYEGRLNLALDLDFARLAGWSGLSFHGNVFQIHGRGLSRDDIGNLMLASSIEALATTRLYEAWFEQKFAGDKISVRAGQLAADTEFITSKYTDVFINSTYGWPAIFGINMPSGGPSPPLAAMGARLKAEVTDQVTLLGALFDGDAAGPGTDDPQRRNRYGVNFRVNDPPLLIGEVQYAYSQQKGEPGLPGTVRLGGWYHAGLFADQRLTGNGLSQADPNGTGVPAQLRSDFGVYGVFEQLVLRLPGNDTRGVGIFTRVAASPQDRNLVSFYADGGLNFQGPFPQRPNDKLGLGFGYLRISDRARDLDRDFIQLANANRPVRDFEALAAVSYLAEVRQGWTVNPTLQYIVHPGGGYVLDAGVPQAVKNALVLGVRTVLKF